MPCTIFDVSCTLKQIFIRSLPQHVQCTLIETRHKKCKGTVISIFILQKHWWIRKLVFSSAGRWSYPKVTCQRLEIDSPFNKERSILGVPPLFSVMEKVYIRNNFVTRLCFHERLNDFCSSSSACLSEENWISWSTSDQLP